MQVYILLAIVSSILYGIGLVIQKKGIEKISGLKLLKNFSIKNLKKLIRKLLNKKLLSGVIIGGIGTLFYWKAISIGELSILQPLTNINVIVVWIFGWVYLKERIRSREWIGLLLIFVGAVTLSVSA